MAEGLGHLAWVAPRRTRAEKWRPPGRPSAPQAIKLVLIQSGALPSTHMASLGFGRLGARLDAIEERYDAARSRWSARAHIHIHTHALSTAIHSSESATESGQRIQVSEVTDSGLTLKACSYVSGGSSM